MHITYGAQVSFGDLTPYLTYGLVEGETLTEDKKRNSAALPNKRTGSRDRILYSVTQKEQF